MAIQTMSKIADPINGTTKEKDPHLYDYDKVVHSKDDMKGVNRGLQRLNYKITGKDAFDENGNHKGFKCSAKCRPEVAEGTIVEMRTGLRNSIMLQKTETMKSGWTIRILILLTKKSLEKRLKNITKLDAQIAKLKQQQNTD